MWLSRKNYKKCFSTLLPRIGFGQITSRVLRIGFGQIIKLECDPAEVEAMEYVRQHTSIPIPKIIKTYKHEGDGCQVIIMQYVDGVTLGEAWFKMTGATRQVIAKELAGYVAQLRQLAPPKAGFVGSLSLGPGFDHRFGDDRFGPFNNMEDFHTYILRGDSLDMWKGEKDVLQVHSKPNYYVTKFTHGDLNPSNIIVKNGHIVVIIDWQTAGWFPEYWEYTKMQHQWRPAKKAYYEEMDRVMVTYPVELAAEKVLWKRYDWYQYENLPPMLKAP